MLPTLVSVRNERLWNVASN